MHADSDPPLRLGQFILRNMEVILQRWEDFARSIWPGDAAEVVTLRNDAETMLRAVVADMDAFQSEGARRTKSEGTTSVDPLSPMNSSALHHAEARVDRGFSVVKLVSEFRALRASVNQLWRVSPPVAHPQQLEDMVRFDEAIDQLISTSVTGYSERVERSRKLFLGMLGHDLRQPLGSMRMFVELMAAPERLPGGPGAVITQMKTCCDAMSSMLSDLLDFTASQLGSAIPIERGMTDLGALSRVILDEMQSANRGRSFSLATAGDLNGEWDVARLRQLISNLLSNALQHGCPNSGIRLSITGSAETVEIAVHNLGAPIPEEGRDTIFDPMIRMTEDEYSKRRGSMGLGLYICRQIVISHGGTIRVASDKTDGTTFTVTLPRA